MDEWKPDVFFQGMPTGGISASGFEPGGDPSALSARLQVSRPESSQRVEQVAKDLSSARKIHKADREKMRRDRLNEQFMDLGNAIDSDRPRNDKATILGDAILMLKDLTAQVHKLKAEHTSLSDESRELAQEKNELREEKAALKSEIDSLNIQYQPRLGCLYPWATVDPSVVMRPPSPYPFPIPVPVPSGPMPFHSPIPLYPFFQNQSQVAVPSPCSSYHPYGSSNPYVEQQPIQPLPSHPHPGNSNNNNTVCKHESQSTPADQRGSGSERSSAEFNDVVTELELKMPGSASPSSDSKTTTNEQVQTSMFILRNNQSRTRLHSAPKTIVPLLLRDAYWASYCRDNFTKWNAAHLIAEHGRSLQRVHNPSPS